MASISNTTLTVDTVVDHPGLRRVRVGYDLEWDPNDACPIRVLVEQAVVHAVDEHDAPAHPRHLPVAVFHRTVRTGDHAGHREFETTVRRTDLDVEQDWWSTDESGATVPIAEWADHLIADISLHEVGDEIASGSTPVITGSWGALGQD